MSQENVEIVRRMYKAFLEGDFRRVGGPRLRRDHGSHLPEGHDDLSPPASIARSAG
jgi:hypothetical protein